MEVRVIERDSKVETGPKQAMDPDELEFQSPENVWIGRGIRPALAARRGRKEARPWRPLLRPKIDDVIREDRDKLRHFVMSLNMEDPDWLRQLNEWKRAHPDLMKLSSARRV
jgi:hypothetical protein